MGASSSKKRTSSVEVDVAAAAARARRVHWREVQTSRRPVNTLLILFDGPPNGGKTAMAKQLAKYEDPLSTVPTVVCPNDESGRKSNNILTNIPKIPIPEETKLNLERTLLTCLNQRAQTSAQISNF